MKYRVSVERAFSAAHALRGYKGKCERLHGHNWKVRLTVSGARLNGTGMLRDFSELREMLDRVLQGLDHRYLNEVPPFDTINPTAENIARYVFNAVARGEPGVAEVSVWESDSSFASVSR